MKLLGLFFLALALAEVDKRLFDDIADHDEFNIAEVDGVGFDRLELEMRKRNMPLPPSMRQSDGKEDVKNKH